jgi:hypothetical protein
LIVKKVDFQKTFLQNDLTLVDFFFKKILEISW